MIKFTEAPEDEDVIAIVTYIQSLPLFTVLEWSSHHVDETSIATPWVDVYLTDENALLGFNWVWTIDAHAYDSIPFDAEGTDFTLDFDTMNAEGERGWTVERLSQGLAMWCSIAAKRSDIVFTYRSHSWEPTPDEEE